MINENLRFLRKALTLPRTWNAIKVYAGYFLSLLTRKPHIWGYPPVVMIEPTNICNLQCPLCPSGNGTLKRDKGYMSLATFKNIIDQVHKKSFMIVLWNQGEPFLNNDILQMIRYASDHKMFTLLSTNGNIKIDARALVKSGLDSLIISLDGATQDTYNKYRINGKLSVVLDFAKSIVKARLALNKKNPLLRWQFLVMKHNEPEINAIRKMAKDIQVDNLELKTVQIYSKEDIDNFLPLNPRYRRYKISSDNFELKAGIPNRCRRIWVNMVINWNGEMSVCCFDKDIDHALGNSSDQSLISIWKGKAFQHFRKQILSNRKIYPMCNNCGESVKMRVKQTRVN
ncbi:MAG: radical SAM/SPASM domain-containing protein [Candidatus Stygibacter frigidus]|nr:radical SAM/SPASM domain-containing protein [Candidatus Stygibacter frigidus]